jgi:membrane fusion protein (multidrug efflux system)
VLEVKNRFLNISLYPHLIFLLVLVISCSSDKKEQSKGPKGGEAIGVDIIIARNETVNSQIEANGTLLPMESVELRSEISGKLTYLNIPEGKNVATGTLIAKVNDLEIQAQIKKLLAQIELAEKNEKRLKKLIDLEGISQSDYDNALNQVIALKADLEYAKVMAEKCEIKAPFTGTLGLRKISPGAYVTPSTLLATLTKERPLKVDFTLPEKHLGLISAGGKVQVKTSDSESLLTATISAIEPLINDATRNVQVRAVLEGNSGSPGAFVTVYLTGKARKNSFLVPSEAVIPDASGKQLIVCKNGKAGIAPVITGERFGANVEILEGISTGDSIVVTGVLFAKPDAPLKIEKVLNTK